MLFQVRLQDGCILETIEGENIEDVKEELENDGYERSVVKTFVINELKDAFCCGKHRHI
jgi:hypothetical protein